MRYADNAIEFDYIEFQSECRHQMDMYGSYNCTHCPFYDARGKECIPTREATNLRYPSEWDFEFMAARTMRIKLKVGD